MISIDIGGKKDPGPIDHVKSHIQMNVSKIEPFRWYVPFVFTCHKWIREHF